MKSEGGYDVRENTTPINSTSKHRREPLGRIGYSTGEAARALGTHAPALRRHFERQTTNWSPDCPEELKHTSARDKGVGS
jgi:hypothetical protein